jgi:hypothetical protein
VTDDRFGKLERELVFPALTMKMYFEFEERQGRELGPAIGAQLIEAIDYALVHSKAATSYLEQLLVCSTGDWGTSMLAMGTARTAYRHRMDPEYVIDIIRCPFVSSGRDEDERIENRLLALHHAGVPKEYALSLRVASLSVEEVVSAWQSGIAAEYAVVSMGR